MPLHPLGLLSVPLTVTGCATSLGHIYHGSPAPTYEPRHGCGAAGHRERLVANGEALRNEALAVIEEGDVTIERIRSRFVGAPSEEIGREAVKAVREVRQEAAAKERAAG